MGAVRSEALRGRRARLVRDVTAKNGTRLAAGEVVTIGGASRARRRGGPQRVNLEHEDGRFIGKVELDAVAVLDQEAAAP